VFIHQLGAVEVYYTRMGMEYAPVPQIFRPD